MIYGEKDELVSKESIEELNNRLKNQKGIEEDFSEIKNANHFFSNKEEELKKTMNMYVKKKHRTYLNLIISPPVVGLEQPVVPGKDIGSFIKDLIV